MRRVITLVVILALAGTGAWVFARHSESPSQVAARAAAPSPVPVVATVKKGYVNPPVSLMALAQESGIATITPPSTLSGVVTRAVAPLGSIVNPGNVVLHVNGEPVFVLPGSFPLYRDVVAGDIGDDVREIQEGLKAAGLFTATPDGVFGARMQRAVAELYRRVGLVAPTASALQQSTATAGNSGVTAGDGSDSGAVTPPVSAQPGSFIRAAEFVVAPHLPARVVKAANVGDTIGPDKELLTLGSGDVVVSAVVPTGSLGVLAAGAKATFVDDAGTSSTGTVVSVTPDQDSSQVTVQVAVTGKVTAGKSYLVTVENPAGVAEQSLLVPTTAVVTRHGTSFVYVKRADGFTEAQVDVTGTEGGTCAVTPTSGASGLAEGVQVRVG